MMPSLLQRYRSDEVKKMLRSLLLVKILKVFSVFSDIYLLFMFFSLPRIYSVILGFVSFFIFANIVHGNETSIIQNIIKIKTYISTPYSPFVFTSYGSAIAISPSRILTNAHVILDSTGEPT